jgi:hypothetical protein
MGKIDKKRLKSLFRSGMRNKDIAEYFGVTPGAISQHTTDMKRSEHRAVILEKTPQFIQSHLDVVEQLKKINDAITFELDKAKGEADLASGAERIKFSRLIVELSSEVRRQLDSQLKIFELWHDASVISEFQNEVLDILESVKPGTRNEIINKLKQRKVIRSTVKFS